MADVKISGLPASTTPLAGTEVLPLVQGGVTKKVAVTNLTGTTVSNAGEVGVGGDTAGVVAGVAVTSKFCVKQDGTNPVAGFVKAENTTANSGSAMFACRSRGTLAAPTIVQNGDSLWNMYLAGHDGTDLALAAEIDVQVDGTPGSNDMPGRILFKTTPDGSQIPAERMRIDSSGNVGIGTTAVYSKFQVGTISGFNRETTASFFGTNTIASSLGTVGIYSTEAAGANVGPALTLGGNTGNAAPIYPFGLIQAAKNSASAGDYGGYIRFLTIPANGGAPVENLRLTTGGGVQALNTISVGYAIPATSGAGITFPATQSASSDVNTLDDYEEGTWTPAVTTNNGTATGYSDISGSYTKVGRSVTIQGSITPTGGTFAGYVQLSGLPFTPATNGVGAFVNSANYTAGEFGIGAVLTNNLNVYVMNLVISVGNVMSFTITYNTY
jgi:hypothetical protein